MKSVYNRYEEYFLTVRELKGFFDKCFLMTKHKKTCVLNMTINEYLELWKLKTIRYIEFLKMDIIVD